MKHIITKAFLILLFFSVAASVKAQPIVYKYGQQWNVYSIPTSSSPAKSCTLIFHSDNHFTQYAGNVYKLLYVDSGDIMGALYGLYRENDGKVFIRELNSMQQPQEEHLLYDWNISIGDVAYVQQGDLEIGLVLDAITDTTMNGNNRRVFHLHYETDNELTEIWVEGMGSELGFPFSGTKNNPVSPFYYPMTTEMLCYYEGGDLFWDNPAYDECVIDYWGNIPEIEECTSVFVYPNPTRGDVTIKKTFHREAIIEIYDLMGRIVFHDNMENEEKKVDMSCFPKGMYIVSIQDYESTKRSLIIKN